MSSSYANWDIEVWLRIWTERGTSADNGSYAGGYVGFVAASMAFGMFDVT